jgi:hypothetical protein
MEDVVAPVMCARCRRLHYLSGLPGRYELKCGCNAVVAVVVTDKTNVHVTSVRVLPLEID